MNLPQPEKSRWQPLRLGLVELYHYDAEEFWFADGHLLLRGNNGTGKSKVLSLTLPFLLDASLSPARLEPDADRGKRMEWNLLMGGRYERRTGYVWIEFGRLEDGEAKYLTLGCGLRATAGRRSVDSWFFVTEQRIGHQLSLISEQQTALTRERLAEAIGSHAVYTTARDYRRTVDEHLFNLGAERYRALTDTLIQLRQPQLSKQPNEHNLSEALSQAFAPLDRVVLEDVADAMTQLDEYRDELDDYESMHRAVAQFNRTYQRYAQILARRRARDLRQAQTAFDSASAEAKQAQEAFETAQHRVATSEQAAERVKQRLSAAGGQIEALRESPEMRGAQALERAQGDAEQAQQNATAAEHDQQRAQTRHAQEEQAVQRRSAATDATRDALAEVIADSKEQARAAGIASEHEASWNGLTGPDAIGQAQASARTRIHDAQTRLADQRGKQIGQIRKRLDEVATAQARHAQQQSERDARHADSEASEAAVATARQAQTDAADRYIQAWQAFIERAQKSLPADWPDVEETLADWVTSLAGASPLDPVLSEAERRQRADLSRRDAALSQQQTKTEQDLEPLRREHAELGEGRQPEPPAPATRETSRSGRAGAPLWQVIDFAQAVTDPERAGLEAALQASGMLDAWVSPDGELLHPDTQDVWLTPRAPQSTNLGQVLRADTESTQTLDAERVNALLAGIALGDNEDSDNEASETWVASDGRFRIGPVRGAWSKDAAEYIGFAAREAARQRRLAALELEIQHLEQELTDLGAQRIAISEQQQALDALLSERPDADELRQSHATLTAAETSATQARVRLAEAENRLQQARQALERAREDLQLDAEDARLPASRDALETVNGHLNAYRRQLVQLRAAMREHAQALAELTGQREREASARADLEQAVSRARRQAELYEQAGARHAELQRTVGASAEQVLVRLSQLRSEYAQLEHERDTRQSEFIDAREQLGGARSDAENSATRQQEKLQERGAAIGQFQAFAATGLLRAAVPELDIPDTDHEWRIEAALTTARRAEQALQTVADSDDDWDRIQKRVGDEFTELQRAMSARGYQSSSELGDHGFVVRVVFNQSAEAPDRLQALLDGEIGERRSLLTAKEREIIENHLQAEVAAQLQQLMRDADARVQQINAELEQRPTSTGVKFKLVWQPREDAESATLVGLADVRKTLLNKSSDAWSPDDRAAVGQFLQQRIASQREAAEGAARIDQLAGALDYRAWHQFRVRRWQDGKWRPLSGPASSGERALGLTVPLFAAASSHYESAAAHAPRLVLLDEAFAGIDDAARAHCMDLIREFDLDFVMTSEREWGCYAELPGVAICHLVRREGVDAVFVSRWQWNGRSREPMAAPERGIQDAQ